MNEQTEEERERRRNELKWLGLSDQMVEDILNFPEYAYETVPKELSDKVVKNWQKNRVEIEEERARQRNQLKRSGLSNQMIEKIVNLPKYTYEPPPKEFFDKSVEECVDGIVQRRQEKTREESRLPLWRRWWNKFLSLFR